jgi:hypothetical protein
VVAGAFAAAHVAIDAAGLQSRDEIRAEQEMIDPEPGVAGICIPE